MRAAFAALLGFAAAAGAQVPVERLELTGAIVGRVCRDAGADGRCDATDPGVSGARVMLETGQVAIADAQGRFHFAAVSARVAEATYGGRLPGGRHRVALDTRGLAPGETAPVPARTVEVPMAGVVAVDFAIRPAPRSSTQVSLAPQELPPSGVLQPQSNRVRFLLAGRASPGDRVTVQGQPAELSADGLYRAWVELAPGANDVPIVAEAPSGAVRLFTQRVDVVQRQEGVLVIPRSLDATASAQLPGGTERSAATGETSIHFQSAPGTVIRYPGGEVRVGPDGAAVIPVDLKAGNNQVPVEILREGQPARSQQLEIPAAHRPALTALLDLEATFSPQQGRFRLMGRGGAHGEYRFGELQLVGELELRDTDFTAANTAHPVVLLLPRAPERFERSLDPERAPLTFGDDATELSHNPSEGRLRVELRHDTFGAIGLGTYRARLRDAEVGRFQRSIFGPYLELSAPVGEGAAVHASGFFAPQAVDPARPLTTLPAYEELTATGGSLFYLSHAAVAEGSEQLSVELRDGRTGLPLAERHLVRGRDYEIDYLQGRILLAAPLSFLSGEGVLRTAPLSAGNAPVLVASYERVVLGPGPAQLAGGEVGARVGPVQLSLGAVDSRTDLTRFQLFRGVAQGTWGGFSLSAEGALSQGDALGLEGFSLSDDGGLSFLRPAAALGGGTAYGLRLRGPGVTAEGELDAAYRFRSAGYSDFAHADVVDHSQLSVRARQPLGDFRLGLLVDLRSSADPRTPFEARPFSSRHLGASVGYRLGALEAGLEAEDVELTASATPEDDIQLSGGRLAAGAYARYQVLPWLGLAAGHRQALAVRGAGPGALDDTFTHLGTDLRWERVVDLGLRAGWGPLLGPRAWFEASHQRGQDAYYGGYSVDVDGPDLGQGRAVSGARTLVGQGAAVFVEDVAAHDANTVRLSRAVGFSQTTAAGLGFSARYERGGRHPLGADQALERDAGGVAVSWIGTRLRLSARGEVRRETGQPVRGATAQVERLQGLLSGAAEAELTDSLRFSGRVNVAHTRANGFLDARFLEATTALVWRIDPAILVARYSARRELSPATRKLFGERTFHTVSLLPALRVGDRFQLGSGLHAAWNSEGGNQSLVLSGSLRPSVRVVGGLELAAEVAARTVSQEGEQWAAMRGEAGYRFDERIMIAAGYTFFGFTGLGLLEGAEGRADRLYLRAELAY